MGRGNVCVLGKCEGLYYVDNEFIDELTEDGEYDEIASYFNRSEFEYELAKKLTARFSSFVYVDKWISGSRRALLENELFYIVVEDNEWSVAVELIQKYDTYGSESLIGLQMGLYKKYLKAIEDILLDMNGEVGIYAGAWTHGVIRK